MFVVKIDGVNQLSINVQLQLLTGEIADSDGFRAAITVQMVECNFS